MQSYINTESVVWIIPMLPLLNFFLINFFLKKNSIVSAYLTNIFIFLSLIFTIILSYKIICYKTIIEIKYFNWIIIDKIIIPLAFYVDNISCIWLLIINIISFFIVLYSIEYMKNDTHINKFFSYISLFIFFMNIMILSNNYILLFLGWEGVGLISYLLIGFWNNNQYYNKLANKIFLINKIGDICLLISIILIIHSTNIISLIDIKHFNISTINHIYIYIITIGISIAALIKGSQFPFHHWLPKAMIGPTPVSGLIHSATMVTGGLYLIIRSLSFYHYCPLIMKIISISSIITIIISSFYALIENELKKILAYSTISHLGYMFLSISINNISGCIYHMITHAFFKSLLFISVGNIMIKSNHNGNIKKYNFSKQKIFFEYIMILIGSANIIGIPPFGGFFSKENILISVLNDNIILGFINIFGVFLTGLYIYRMLYYVFWNVNKIKYKKNTLILFSTYLPITVLACISSLIGIINIIPVFNHKISFLNIILQEFQINNYHYNIKNNLLHQYNIILIMLIFLVEILSIYIGYRFFFKKKFFNVQITLYNRFYNKYTIYIITVYNKITYAIYHNLYIILQFIENKIVNITSLLNKIFNIIHKIIIKIQTRNIDEYIIYIIIGIISIILLFLLYIPFKNNYF